jgi:RNA polymerase sigma-70 factor (ECF subfamily)
MMEKLDLEYVVTVMRTESATSSERNEAAELVFAEMIGFAANYVGADAEDAFLEWYVRVLPGICRRYDGRAPFRSYAFDSLWRWCLKYRQRQRCLPSLCDDVADKRPQMPCRVWQSDLRRRIYHALLQLPEAERTVFVLIEIEELSRSEAAQRLGCTLGALDARLFRARRRLKELLKDLAEFL